MPNPKRQQSKRARTLNRGKPGKEQGPFVTWLPVPDRRIGPNSRSHWRVKAKLVKEAREGAFISAIEILGPRSMRWMCWHEVTARATFHFPDRRRRDSDNLAALLKPVWDGLVDAGLLIDDDRITHLPVEIVHERGCTPVVKIEVWDDTGALRAS